MTARRGWVVLGTPGDRQARLGVTGQCTSASGLTVLAGCAEQQTLLICHVFFYCCLKHGESPLKLHMPDGPAVHGVMSLVCQVGFPSPLTIPSLRTRREGLQSSLLEE